ncbi:MAG: TonB-dependent receptor domain-containing protein, partial [Novosphingobium sp.]
ALRVVGWYQRDAGYIDNVPGTRTFCGTPVYDGEGVLTGCIHDGISMNNSALVKKDYNDTEIAGGRAALKIDLDDSWTVTPAIMYQDTRSHGSYGYDASVGDLQVQHFFPEFRSDKFVQAALTIEGKLGNWDLTYAGAYLDRKTFSSSDYTDYAEAYDALYAAYISESGYQCSGLAGCLAYVDASGNTINGAQKVIGSDHFKKFSQELRVASPSTEPFRVVAGAFYQYQSNDIHQDYQVAGLAPEVSVNGFPGTLWLTQQHRIDRDYAMFGELSYDIADTLTFTAGARAFFYHNDLIGFFGFGRNPGNGYSDSPPNAAYSNRTGVAQCFTTSGERLYDRDTDTYSSSLTLLPGVVSGSPCTNLGTYVQGVGVVPVKATGEGMTYRFNLTWKPQPGLMVYATASKGYRPGGINRRADVAPYGSDFLYNFELGWKATLAPGLRFNGAIYQQNWKKFQFSFLGANSFTEIHNGPDARIRGIDADLAYSGGPLNLTLAAAYTDAKMTKNLCSFDDPTYECIVVPATSTTPAVTDISSPTGTRLPITPKFKVTGTARYTADMGTTKVYGQVNAAYQSSATSEVRASQAAIIGELPAFTTVNLSLGANFEKFDMELFVSNLFDERGQISRFLQCGQCGLRPYIVPITPRTVGLRMGAKF